MGALKRSNRESSSTSKARKAQPTEDLDSGPRSGVRAKRARETPSRARASAPSRDTTTPRTRSKSARGSAAARGDEFAFLTPDVSALDWADAESFAEEFIASATAAEAVNEDARDEVVVEEMGGPFVDIPVETLPFGAVDWFGEEEPLG